ncbi:MAG: hydroxymethylglutaryl-CoA lyase [Streptosporangiales bacterium]|nr:hydroxymethylglutaryl-CoA lyase [Streptosporangiales bacterium]
MSTQPLPAQVHIREVGPRDGFQAEAAHIPTDKKIAIVDALSASGVPTIQVTSVVHPKAVPQLADAEEVMARIERRPDVKYSILVPNLRGAERAVPLQADEWDLMLSVTDAHSRSNANRNTDEAMDAVAPVVELGLQHGVEVVGGMATALGCPFEGRPPYERLHHVAGRYHELGVRHLTVADTVGVADPALVLDRLSRLRSDFPDVELTVHLHNTRGMALANVLAAMQAGVTSFDSAVGGLGGCPFAPGATGNLATDDLVHMLQLMEIETGVDIDAMLALSRGVVTEAVGHELESAVARAGVSWALHAAPDRQVKAS